MKRFWRILKVGVLSVAALLVVLVAGGALWVYVQLQPRDVRAAASKWPSNMSPEAADRAALELVGKMSLDEKLDEMHGAGMTQMMLSMVFRRTAAPSYAGGSDRRGIPPVAFTDGPRGVICGHSTAFPVAIARAATWDRDLERRVGDVIGKEARAQGANYWGGLCVNIVRHPSMGRAEETYGEDPWLTGEMAVAAMEAVQRHNVMACAKHYALNSQETARFKNDVAIDERPLREVYLPQFRKLVERDVASLMSAYNKVRGEWCGESRYLLTTVLREEWGFRGFVTSDWIWGVYDAARGVHAGLDIEMPSPRVFGSLKELVEAGTVAPEEIDESVRRIVRTKLVYLTRDDPMEYSPALAAAPDHVALAREVAEKAMVLLKNEGPLLPLDRSDTRTIAVVGRLADEENTGDRGSSNVSPPHRTSALQGLRDFLGKGAVLHADGSDLAEVARVAAAADAVVVVVGSRHDEVGEYITMDEKYLRPSGPDEKKPAVFQLPGQDEPMVLAGGDRVPLSLKDVDREVVEAAAAANPRCVVTLVGGSVFTVAGWKDDVPSILMAWYFGMEGGHALARVLFGEVNPGGKMPLTTPKDEGHLPFFDEFADRSEYGPYHGYTLLDHDGHEAEFPFGYGLSYTTYAYTNLEVLTPEVAPDGRADVTVDVTNTGDRAGEEAVQLYVGFAGSKVERPTKLLRDFRKVRLAPGETKTVALGVDVKDLAWYDPEAKAWTVEPMTYGLLVGPSSRDADLLPARFTVAE